MLITALFIINSPKLETIHRSISYQTDRQIVAYPYNGKELSDIKEYMLRIHATARIAQKHYVKGKKPDIKDYVFYSSICMKCSEKANLDGQKD